VGGARDRSAAADAGPAVPAAARQSTDARGTGGGGGLQGWWWVRRNSSAVAAMVVVVGGGGNSSAVEPCNPEPEAVVISRSYFQWGHHCRSVDVAFFTPAPQMFCECYV